MLNGTPFSYFDFQTLSSKNSQVYFRQLIHKLKPIIETVQGGRPKYYKLKDLYLDKELTDRYTNVPINERIFSNLDILLSTIRHEMPQLHNIVFTFKTDGLYERLVELNYKINSNKMIMIDNIQIHNRIDVKAQVYPTGTVVLHLACTYDPIDYTPDGFITMISLLGEVYHSLKT